MRTKNFLKHLIMGALLLTTGRVVGQTSVLGNVAGAATDFLGWDNTMPNNNFPLMVRHDLNQPIDFYTNVIQRMRLSPDVTSLMGPSNQFTNVNRDGYLLLSGQPDAFTNGASRAPFTRLHLIDQVGSVAPIVYAQEHGFRPWQRNGITFTGNSDHSYIGHRYSGGDNTDFVIQWSDNPAGSPWGTDRMKFIFTTNHVIGTSYGALSEYGLEAMRLWPKNTIEANLGIGDFFSGNLSTPLFVTDPSERLDILNGRLRIRQLPNDPPAVDSFYVMVVDRSVQTATNHERGVVKWVDPSSFTTTDCDWVVDPNTSGTYDICTAYTGSSCQWDDSHNVGVGTTGPQAKVDVIKTVNNSSATADVGVNVRMGTTNLFNRGVNAEVFSPGGQENAGGIFSAANAPRTYGVKGFASTAFNQYFNWGVYGEANGVQAQINYGVFGKGLNSINRNYGLYGEAITAGSPTNIGVYGRAGNATTDNWAGLFDGDVNINGDLYLWQVYFASDAALKTNITPLLGASNIISQLNPSTYEFTATATADLDLPTGIQRGLIAQDVELILPELVSELNVLAELDSMGAVITPGQTIKTVNYVGFIPVLIAGMKEQMSEIQSLKSDVLVLQTALAACCSAPPSDTDSRSLLSSPASSMLSETKLTIQPNPIIDRTTVSYTLDRSGQLLLVVTAPSGKQIQVLREGIAEPGTYIYEWETGALSSGMYYVTLLLDGELVTKKAVKL